MIGSDLDPAENQDVLDALFRRLFESGPAACIALAPDSPRFRIVAVSDAYLRAMETCRSDLIGRGLFEAFPPATAEAASTGRASLLSSLEHVIRSRSPNTLTAQRWAFHRPDGRLEERTWNWVNSPVFDKQNELAFILHQIEDVTERKSPEQLQAEAAAGAIRLAREEAAHAEAENARRQLAAVLESITDACFALDAGWRFTYINKRAGDFFERTREELLGRSLWDAFPMAWDSRFGQEYRRAMEDGEKRQFEAFSSTLNRWFEVHAYPSRDALSVYFHDITERRRTEAALREAERCYRSLFDSSMDAILLLAPDGRIAMANSASTRLFGYSEEELRALDQQALIDASSPRLTAAIEERRRTGRFRGEITLTRKGGASLPVEISSANFRDEQGAEWTNMFIRDISERRAREAERDQLVTELDAKRHWLQAVLDHVPVGVILFGPDHSIYVNHRTEALFGMQISPSGGSAQYANRLLFPDGTPVPPEQLVSSRVFRSGETVLGAEFLIEHSDGTRIPILGSAAPLHNTEGKRIGAIGIFQEVSERMKAQEAIRVSEQQLRRALRLSEEVLSIVAHDLRNPLSAIGLRAQSLLRSITEARQKKNLQVIISSAQQMNTLIEDLLDIARLESGSLRLARSATEVAPLLEHVLEVHGPLLAEAGLRLAVRVEPGLPRIEADAGRISQVLSNLLGNAVKFTPSGGSITVAAERREDVVCLSVEDTGPGITQEQQSHLFERFWQGSSTDRRGAGLGLSICKVLVEAHGGKIWLENAAGQGSAFRFTIPTAY